MKLFNPTFNYILVIRWKCKAKEKIPVFPRTFLNKIGYIYIQCSLGLSPPRFIANLAYRQNSRLSRFPPLKIPRYTAKLSYRHPPQVFRHKSRKTNINSPVSTANNYLLTAVYWSVIMECENWSSNTVIGLIVEGRNRWSVVLIRIISLPVFTFLVITFVFLILSKICN